MLKRRMQIAELIRSEREISIAELRTLFPDVSEMTLRRDLEYLEQQGQIVRVHGGAKSIEAIAGLVEEKYAQRSLQRSEEKNLIAAKAVELLRPNMVVFIDSGSTTTALSRLLPDLNLRIVTSGLTCALELARLHTSSVEVIGGELNHRSLSTFGVDGLEQLEHMNFDIAFLGATGFHLQRGFTTGLRADSALKRKAIERSHQAVVLVDSSKVGKVYAYTFARLEDVDVVVTDDGIDAEVVETLQGKGIEVL